MANPLNDGDSCGDVVVVGGVGWGDKRAHQFGGSWQEGDHDGILVSAAGSKVGNDSIIISRLSSALLTTVT